MLYLFELTYAMSFSYAMLNYTFDEDFVIIQFILSFFFPFINALIMVIMILFIFELRRLQHLFSTDDQEQFLNKDRSNTIN